MQVSTKHGFVFLCMPKCASTSIEHALAPHCQISFSGPPRVKHIPAPRYHLKVAPLLDVICPDTKFEVVCLMRHPFTWLSSWYRYRQRRGLRGRKQSTQNVSFDEFVEGYMMGAQRPVYAPSGRQYSFTRKAGDEPGVDLIFDLERIDLFVSYIERKTGSSLSLPKKNASRDADVVLDPAVGRRLRDYLAQDLELYESVSATGCLDTRA